MRVRTMTGRTRKGNGPVGNEDVVRTVVRKKTWKAQLGIGNSNGNGQGRWPS